MKKLFCTLISACVVLGSVVGCSNAARTAEETLDRAVESEYPSGVVYLSSRDSGVSESFMPDAGQPLLMIMTNCFNPAREDMPSIKLSQDSEVIAQFGGVCADGNGHIGMVPALFDAKAGKVTVEIAPEDAKDLAFRLIGYNDPIAIHEAHREESEEFLDVQLESTASATVYVSSRDGVLSPTTFTLDPSLTELAVSAACFSEDRGDEVVEITLLQGSEVLTTLGMTCAPGEQSGTVTPETFDPGQDVTVEITPGAEEDLALRIFGYTD